MADTPDVINDRFSLRLTLQQYSYGTGVLCSCALAKNILYVPADSVNTKQKHF